MPAAHILATTCSSTWPLICEHPRTFAILWGALRRVQHSGLRPGRSLCFSRSFDRQQDTVWQSIARCDLASSMRCNTSLVDCANAAGTSPDDLFDESLTVVYRILFLMFAESRSLVPNWHPLYKKNYTIESLRDRVERPQPCRGLWETLQAIARLAHRGCQAGTLVVPAFNGRLFSPSRSPVAESCRVDDEIARRALLALSTSRHRSTRSAHRLSRPWSGAARRRLRERARLRARACPKRHAPALSFGWAANRRKSTGSFYTPQSITDYVVRRTLHPLVAEASSRANPALRIVDPAMGSAAFLVSACRYLAGAYEARWCAKSAIREADIDESDRAGFRRQIAQRCLFGVDLESHGRSARAAVAVARHALGGKPLTFLDHRLVMRQQPARRVAGRRRATAAGPRSPNPVRHAPLRPCSRTSTSSRRWRWRSANAAGSRRRATTRPTLCEKRNAGSTASRTRQRWKTLADLWCACWMWPDRTAAPDAALFSPLRDERRTKGIGLPKGRGGFDASAMPRRSREHHRFFHWMLEFPEVYFDDKGRPLANARFRRSAGQSAMGHVARRRTREKAFLSHVGNLPAPGRRPHQPLSAVRRTRSWHLQSAADASGWSCHRDLRPTTPGATPAALLHGASSHRHDQRIRQSQSDLSDSSQRPVSHLHVDSRCADEPNRVPLRHRRPVRCSKAFRTPATAADRASHPIIAHTGVDRALWRATNWRYRSCAARPTLRILERIVHAFRDLGDCDGWDVRFGRELNATDDRGHFHPVDRVAGSRGKAHRALSRARIERISREDLREAAARLLDARRTFMRARARISRRRQLDESLVAHRGDSSGRRRHDAFAVLPEDAALAADNQAFLCAMLNSFVANYLVRLVMTTHLGSATVEGLARAQAAVRFRRVCGDCRAGAHAEHANGRLGPRSRAPAGAGGAVLWPD